MAVRWRLCALAVWVPLLVFAQSQAPVGLIHGTMLDCQSTGSSGKLTIRTADNRVFHFAFDDKTYVEREQELSRPGKLEKGDWLEIVAGESPGSALRYARTIHVIERKAPPRIRPVARATAYRSPVDPLFPRGDLTFSEVLTRLKLRAPGAACALRSRKDDSAAAGHQFHRGRQTGRWLLKPR